MLISLLVLSHEQIYVPIWGKHGSFYRGPITLLEQLVVLIGRHKDMLVKSTRGVLLGARWLAGSFLRGFSLFTGGQE